jgi:hypothetical protein
MRAVIGGTGEKLTQATSRCLRDAERFRARDSAARLSAKPEKRVRQQAIGAISE